MHAHGAEFLLLLGRLRWSVEYIVLCHGQNVPVARSLRLMTAAATVLGSSRDAECERQMFTSLPIILCYFDLLSIQ